MWTPIALLPVHANWWAAVVRVPPGIHRVQIRLDGGAWLAPPRLPRADDGPGGPSGTLIVTGDGIRQLRQLMEALQARSRRRRRATGPKSK